MVALLKISTLALCAVLAQAHADVNLASREKDCPQGQSLLDGRQCCNGPLVSVDNEDACCVMDSPCDLKCLRDPPCKDKIKLSDGDYQQKFDKANGKSSGGNSSSSSSESDSDPDSNSDSDANSDSDSNSDGAGAGVEFSTMAALAGTGLAILAVV